MRSLCYPSYMSYAGSGATRQGYAPIVARHFPAVRGLGEFADKPFTCELHYLHNWDAARRSGAELVGPAERSLAQGRWRIPAFHGLEDTHLPMALSDFRELLAHLFGHRHRIWTVPIIAVAQRITGMAGRQVDIRPTTRNQQEGANNGYGLTVGRPSRPD